MLERGGASSRPAADAPCGAPPSSDGRPRTGNGWADYLARCGAATNALAGSPAEAATAALKQRRK
eukprot:3470140-Pyramimonas_sp.AAC.1